MHELQRLEQLIHDVLFMDFLQNICPNDCQSCRTGSIKHTYNVARSKEEG